ncbi:hypothetical protein V5799_016141 [Amblyomma americanum]|uniref:Uncharacterized protein n=1 Tax=Amblyomma americanum TaxID=6943 RepID=A0AAQ4F600_AMBAM
MAPLLYVDHQGEERLPTVPYVYRTPKGQLIDLRLYNTELLRSAMPFLAHILERELRGWFPAFREALVAKLRGFVGKGLSRHLNRIWNYLVKGLVGTVLLVLLFPVVSLVVCSASLVAALLAPLCRFVEQCFGPFAATLARDRGPYRDLEAELSNMVSALKAEVDKRRRELQLGLGVGARQRTRMSAGGLQSALAAGAGLAQQLLPRLPSAYWHERTLEEKDWLGDGRASGKDINFMFHSSSKEDSDDALDDRESKDEEIMDEMFATSRGWCSVDQPVGSLQ